MSFVISLSGFLFPFPGGEREGGFGFLKFCLVSAVGLSEPLTHRLLSILWPIMDLISVTFWHM